MQTYSRWSIEVAFFKVSLAHYRRADRIYEDAARETNVRFTPKSGH